MLFEYFPPYKSYLRWCVNALWKYNNSKTITISLWRPILCRCWLLTSNSKKRASERTTKKKTTDAIIRRISLVSLVKIEHYSRSRLILVFAFVWQVPFDSPNFSARMENALLQCVECALYKLDVRSNIGIAISIEQAIKYHHQYK